MFYLSVKNQRLSARHAYYRKRFFSLVKMPDLVPASQDIVSDSDCWLWQGKLNPNGYGIAHVPGINTQLAHRISYVLTYGDIPKGAPLLHICGNRACVCPGHLKLARIVF